MSFSRKIAQKMDICNIEDKNEIKNIKKYKIYETMDGNKCHIFKNSYLHSKYKNFIDYPTYILYTDIIKINNIIFIKDICEINSNYLQNSDN